MRSITIDTRFYTLFGVMKISSTLVAKAVKRAITKETVKILWTICLVAWEIFTFTVLKKFIVFHNIIILFEKEFSHSNDIMSSDIIICEVIHMAEKKKVDELITDSGVIVDKHTVQARYFIFLCNILTFALAILGIVAFVKGNF